MDKSWMNIVHRTKDPRFESGVNEFLNFAYRGKSKSSKIPCPCKICNNFRHHNRSSVFSHLMQKGITHGYDTWVYHGESCDVSDDSDNDIPFEEGDRATDDSDNDLDEMLENIGNGMWGNNWKNSDGSSSSDEKDLENLRKLFDESRQELYRGCKNYSKFSFIVAILHLKTMSGWSIKSFDALLDIFRKVLPTPSLIPKNFYEAKKYRRELGFHGEKIHACVNDCILYRNEYKYHTVCPNSECKEPRYSGSDSKVPRKVLRYFPLKPRLQRLFIDKELACDMRWHKEKRVNDNNIARHPADSEAWKHLDRVYPLFAEDPRNIRLGLATDGFSLFGNLSNSYSIWPVFLVVYNLPPWKCMKEPYMLMSMLIPGPKSPGINIDVYLQPLIDELNEFWVGVNAYDAYRMEKFSLRAVLLWTINDFPAYGMLSGWSVKGYKACPICMNETSSQYLTHSRKVVYMGHRKFLLCTHHWRKDKKNFNGEVDFGEPVIPKSGHEVLNDIDGAMDFSEPYRFDKTRKRKYSDDTRGWKKKSIFFKLPYWPDLKLRHNIDIMHVVKNVTESLTATLFNIKGKTKDTSKSREDLKDHRLKKSLHLQPHGNSFIMPMACYHFTKNEKHRVINLLKSIKFPDGFASNISRCIKKEEFQLSRMKSHDFYVFIQRVLPLSIRGCLTKEVRVVLYELSGFIQKLCARNVYLDVLEKQEAEIVVILCKLERLLPQSFFDIMIHLLIHLPYEAKLAGPSQYRWMFPFERKIGVLKGYVKNNARPEGCIAERYLDNECLTFCSMYLNDVESAFNMTERNNERGSIFKVKFLFSHAKGVH
ncbi:uncharacterized protein [Rutidosis leptorrhynchoides]|uniref:uncharacterized protein n=1 Tax=Rutidosis leptorrhynchoides TaxID=125765 RepID=UPI003A9A1482